MIPQIQNTMVNTEIETLPSKTYKLNLSEYTKQEANQILEYIESDGNQYIDTEVKAVNGISVELQFELLNFSDKGQRIFGAEGWSPLFMLGTLGPVYDYRFYGGLLTSSGTARTRLNFFAKENTSYNVKLIANNEERKIIIEEPELGTHYIYTTDKQIQGNNPYNLYLFEINQYITAGELSTMRLNYCKIWIDDELIRDFVPVLRSNKDICLYDKITEGFFLNKGTGKFKAGPTTGQSFIKNEVTDYIYPESISGYVDNQEAMRQAIYHLLMTERYAYLIYSNNYGVELDQYIGRPFEYLENNIESTLKDALLYDLRIKNVKVTDIQKINTDMALVKFTVDTIFGDLQMEVNINV